ncbi:MAG: hypothetical protein LBS74_02895 [Oscillospiraceae bacterium]|jgi:hypothetical protein|nr:hypothetical protein [Oscillospiraceae bacterium]
MLINVNELTDMPEFSGVSESVLKLQLEAIEILIRAYTNNNFQNRAVRFEAASLESGLLGKSIYLKIGDTVQITESINDGLYTVTQIQDSVTVVDKPLFATVHNLVTKVEYPAAVVQGALNMLKWDVANRDKVGVKSESISRHSVTYYDMDSNNQINGYPVSLMGFLKPYMKARF